MSSLKIIVLVCSLSTGVIGGVYAQAPAGRPTTSAGTENAATPIDTPDNGDQSDHSPTADTQKNNPTDLNLTRRIRRSVVADKSLSTSAHNVAIIAVNGTVTLRGAVRSQQEKQVVETKATKIAGQDRVVNNLTIAKQ